MKLLFTSVLTLLIAVNSWAADLKGADVSQWLKSMQVLQPWMDKNEEKFSAQISEPTNPDVAFKEAVSALKKAGLYDELNGKLKKLGYESVEQWNQLTRQVTFAWMALEMRQNQAEVEAAKAQYEAMKNNPNIPPEQKAMMEQMMAPALAMVQMANQSSAADQNAVKPHQKALRDHFNANGQ